MKRRKILSLSPDAIARGEQLAASCGETLSSVVERQLLSLPTPGVKDEFWSGPALHPVKRNGDARLQYLKRKHR